MKKRKEMIMDENKTDNFEYINSNEVISDYEFYHRLFMEDDPLDFSSNDEGIMKDDQKILERKWYNKLLFSF